MPDERESPSAGWQEVCREMGADTGVEEALARCPRCGRTCPNVAGDLYDCERHGLFRPGDDAADTKNRVPGTAD